MSRDDPKRFALNNMSGGKGGVSAVADVISIPGRRFGHLTRVDLRDIGGNFELVLPEGIKAEIVTGRDRSSLFVRSSATGCTCRQKGVDLVKRARRWLRI